jgi:hypothetical protein
LEIKAGRLGGQKASSSQQQQQQQQQRVLGGVGAAGKKDDLRPGYTTRDDLGTDGDDTEHASIDFYVVPNCVQADVGFNSTGYKWKEDERVDLVYSDFVQPWIITALQYLALNVTEADTEVYYDGKEVTDVITDWVGENWKCE